MLFTVGILTAMTSKDRLAVEQAKVQAILPLMIAWKEAYSKWANAHNGLYTQGGSGEYGEPTAADLGVSWPADWVCTDNSKTECHNDEWYCSPMDDGLLTSVRCVPQQLKLAYLDPVP